MDTRDRVDVIELWTRGFMVTREINGYRLFSMFDLDGHVYRGSYHTEHGAAVTEAYNSVHRDVRALCREIEDERR